MTSTSAYNPKDDSLHGVPDTLPEIGSKETDEGDATEVEATLVGGELALPDEDLLGQKCSSLLIYRPSKKEASLCV